MFPQDNQQSSWMNKARTGLQAATDATKGASGRRRTPPWYESLGKVGQVAGDAYQKHRANSALRGPDQPLDDAVGSIVDSAPATSAGPAPPVGDAPWKRGADASDSPMDAYGDGRIVTKPTTAIIGDKGPEMVVPLGFRARAKVLPSMAMPRKRSFYGEV